MVQFCQVLLLLCVVKLVTEQQDRVRQLRVDHVTKPDNGMGAVSSVEAPKARRWERDIIGSLLVNAITEGIIKPIVKYLWRKSKTDCGKLRETLFFNN